MTSGDEASLIFRSLHGSTRERDVAFTTLTRGLRDGLFRLCFQLTGNRADAEDALQETLLALHRSLAGFRQDARISTWAYRIAVRAALKIKARNRRRESASFDEVPVALPDEAAIQAQTERLLQRAMASLDAAHRAVLALFAIDGLSHDEIAAILGIPEGTVWSRVHAARKKLKTILASLNHD